MMCGYVIRRRLLIAELELDTQRWTSTLLQVKFLTPTVKAEFFAQATAASVSKMETELSDAIELGRANGGDSFEDIAVLKLSRDGFDGEISVLPPGNTRAVHATTMHLPPCSVRSFVNAEHLAHVVETDLKNRDIHMYAPNNPLVNAWCICTIGDKRMVVGLQVAVAKLKHPIADESVAKEQFDAINGALAKCPVNVHKAALVVLVVPAANCSKTAHQYANVGPGEPQRKAGHIWPHTQAKLAMQQGKPPANGATMRGMLTRSAPVELSADVTVGDLCTLYHMGRRRAAQLLSVLRDNARNESKTVEGFLDSLEDSYKVLAGVLKHTRNQGRWAYRGHVWSGRAPAHVRAAMRPKRKAEADAAGGRHALHHGHAKRARRGKLTGGIHVADNLKKHPVPGV